VRRRPPDRIGADAARLSILQRSDPDRAHAFALDLIARERAHRALEPALALVAEAARPESRPALRARYFDLAEHGDRYDQDCALRVLLVRALASIESRDDRDVCENAIATVQIRMGVDVAQNLRAEGLLLLALIEPELADFRAVELLADPHTSTFSGEPAVTAVRVLAKRGHYLPVWALARRAGVAPDALAQVFASLAHAAPRDYQTEALLGQLAEARARAEAGEATALVAAEAIVLNELANGYSAVMELLGSTPNRNLRDYLEVAVRRSADPRLAKAYQQVATRRS
jgi:hypothetical protein